MADAPALPAPPPVPAGDGNSSPSAPVSVPRVLPSTLLLDTPPPSSGRARGARGDRAAVAAGSRGGRGGSRRKPAAASHGTGGRNPPDRLAEAVRLLGRDVDEGVATADILQLAMAKGPMFSWLSYWPEEGFPKEHHPY